MNVPLVDLVAQYRTIQPEIDRAIQQVFKSGQFILDSNVSALEQEVAAYLGVKHAIGVGSGTDALVLTLRGLGIGPGDEVIVPSYTFIATASAVLQVGARPVLVDIRSDTYCLDVEQVAERITSRTRAMIPVHLYGQSADMDAQLALARAYDLKVIEDNAQAFGAEYRGRKTGGLGDVGCLSFFPVKNLGGYGDGGMVVTNDDDLAEKVGMLRTHGWRKKYDPELLGYNSRLDALQAAILRVKLRHVDAWNERRRRLARQFSSRFAPLGIGVPFEADYGQHVYHLYVIRIEDRDRVQGHLQSLGIASGVYYPLPLHQTELIQPLGYDAGDYPISERASRETLALPLYPEMTDEQLSAVMAAVEATRKPVGISE